MCQRRDLPAWHGLRSVAISDVHRILEQIPKSQQINRG